MSLVHRSRAILDAEFIQVSGYRLIRICQEFDHSYSVGEGASVLGLYINRNHHFPLVGVLTETGYIVEMENIGKRERDSINLLQFPSGFIGDYDGVRWGNKDDLKAHLAMRGNGYDSPD